jgi:hypothetical protein
VSERNLPKLMDIIRQVTAERRRSLQRQTEFLWQNYMSSMRVITLTTLQIINDRFFPQSARSYDEWNELVYRVSIFTSVGVMSLINVRYFYHLNEPSSINAVF